VWYNTFTLQYFEENNMINFRLLALGTTALLIVAACSKDEDSATVAVSESANKLFSYVPADTPYLLGNLQPPSDEVIDTFLLRAEPVLNTVQEELSRARESLDTGNAIDSSSAHGSQQSDMAVQLMHALLQELDGKLSRQGLESLGFDLQSHKVVYGMGVFPVLRIGLSDEQALRASIQRVLENAGINAPEQIHEGVPYWKLSADSAAGLYVSILDGHLAMSIFPPMAEAEFLPAFLGKVMPDDSNAAARLAELNAKHGYTPFGSGILDLNILLDGLLSADSVLARVMASKGNNDLAEMGPECKTEFRGLFSHTPRLTVGTTELTSTAIAIQYRVETESSLAQQLLGLVAEIPAANPLTQRVLEFSFGMRFGAVRDFLRSKATAIMENPYQCEHLLDLNNSATEAYAQLNQAMPPFLNNFLGLRAALSDFKMDDLTSPTASGLAAVHVDKPEMFVGMAQMFVPDLSELEISAGDPPIKLPESLIPTPGMEAYAAIGSQTIGLALGAGEVDGLLDYMNMEEGPTGTFLSLSYDMKAYLEYSQQMKEQYQQVEDDTEWSDSEHADHHRAIKNIGESAQNAFQSFADRSELSMRFTAEGFVTDSKMTFK
jgi:hypothetical protein